MATGDGGGTTDDVDPEAMEMIFVRDRFDDPTKHGKGVMNVQYFGAPLRNIAVFDEFATFLRLYDQDCQFSYRLDLPKPTGMHKPSKLTILATCYVPEESIIVVSASDFNMYLWDMNRGLMGRKKPRIVRTLAAPTSQISLAWNSSSKTLFSASVNQEILAWDMKKRSIKSILRGHRDMIVALCEIPELGILASASLDDTINLYGMSELKHWGTCTGHKKGVRRLAWGHGLLFSCGFEFVVLCWSLDVDETGARSASGEIAVTLTGHEVMLLEVAIVPCAGARVVSADISGRFLMWDVGDNARFSGVGMVLQEFTAGYGFTDTIRTFFLSMECSSGPCIDDDGNSIGGGGGGGCGGGGGGEDSSESGRGDKDSGSSVGSLCTLIAGANDVLRFSLVHTHTKKVDVPSNVLFNPNTLQFFTLAGNDIHIWDASDGRHVHSFWNIFEKSGKAENIECMCFDTRRRKIIAGSEGGQLFVFNSVSGTSMKGIRAHRGPIISVHYADHSRCIVSTGTDRRICVHDESGDVLVLLRAVGSIHPRSIECCAFSEELSQIATGSTRGYLRIVDYDRLNLTVDCVERGSEGNLTSLEFAPNHRPLLVSADTNGFVRVWPVKLSARKAGSDGIVAPLLSFCIRAAGTSLPLGACFTALSMCSLSSSSAAAVTTNSDSSSKEEEDVLNSESYSEMLVLADENGWITEFNLNDIWTIIRDDGDGGGGNDDDSSSSESPSLSTYLAPIDVSLLPLNQPEYNPKLRYEEYQHMDTTSSKIARLLLDEKMRDEEKQKKEKEKERRKEGNKDVLTIPPVRRWQAHQQSIVTIVLTTTPPLILSGSEDEKVHVWSLRSGDDKEQSKRKLAAVGLANEITTKDENATKEEGNAIPKEGNDKDKVGESSIGEKKDVGVQVEIAAGGEEFFGELSHHGTAADDVFDEWHLPLEGLDLTSQHNKAAEELLAQAEEERAQHLLREENTLKRTLELNQLRAKFAEGGLLIERVKNVEILAAQEARASLEQENKTVRITNAIDQVNDDDLPEVPVWQDYFQTIAEDESEKAFSDASLIRGSLRGMFGGEELQRLRMIRKRGMHHIYSFFPPAISGGDVPMPIDPKKGNVHKKATPAVYLHFRKENERKKSGAEEAELKKKRDLEEAYEAARPSSFLIKNIGVKKRRNSKMLLKKTRRRSDTGRGDGGRPAPFFLTPIPSMVTTTSSTMSKSLDEHDSMGGSGFFITAGHGLHGSSSHGLQSNSAQHDSHMMSDLRASSSSSAAALTSMLPSPSRLAPIQSASAVLFGGKRDGRGGGGGRTPTATHFRRRFGASMTDIQARVDAIMLESDEKEGMSDTDVAAAKKAKAEAKKLRAAKKEGRRSLGATSAKKERMDKLEAKKEAKRKEREKDKKNDKKKKTWSKAGISQKEVLDILTAFRSIDEDLTGEIDPKEFFALPQFSAFASPETMDTLFRAIDTDGSGTVTEVELLSVMFPIATKSDVQEMIKMAHRVRFGSKKEEKAKPKLSEEDRSDIETIFNMYDTDNSNTVSLTELLEALGEKLRNIMTSKEIADIFETFDADKNSDLDLDEFITLYEEYFLVPVNEASGNGPPHF